jgi:hypothetical protein
LHFFHVHFPILWVIFDLLATNLSFCLGCCFFCEAISILFEPNCPFPSHFSFKVLFHVWWEKASLFPFISYSCCIRILHFSFYQNGEDSELCCVMLFLWFSYFYWFRLFIDSFSHWILISLFCAEITWSFDQFSNLLIGDQVT